MKRFVPITFAIFLVLPVRAANPARVSSQTEEGIPIKASVGGKYAELLKVIKVPEDKNSYGEFSDFGHWTGTAHAGHTDLPAGHWVYVAPKWYIWGKKLK